MKNKSFLVGLSCYVLWGLLPIYWKQLAKFDAMFLLANRIVGCFCFALLVILVTGRWALFVRTLRDWKTMRLLIPAGVFCAANWGFYVWSVGAGLVVDASLGYFLTPLVVFMYSVVLFRERFTAGRWVAVALAAAGVLVAAVFGYGRFPWVALVLAGTFATYGALTKSAHVDGLVSLALQIMLLTPLALGYLLIFGRGQGGFAEIATARDTVYLLLVGAVTAVPLIIYTFGVNGMPMSMMGILHYVCPTLTLIEGVALFHEPFNETQVVSFALIWAGLLLFSVSAFREEHRHRREKIHAHS